MDVLKLVTLAEHIGSTYLRSPSVTLPPIIMVQWKMGISPIKSFLSGIREFSFLNHVIMGESG